MSEPKRRKTERTSDPNIFMKWFDDLSDNEGEICDDSDGEDDHVTFSDHDSASEQGMSDDDVNIGDDSEQHSTNQYIGKDGVTICQGEKPRPNVRTRAHNIILHLPGPRGRAREIDSEVDLFELFLDNSVVKIITNCTNIYIDTIRDNFGREWDARNTDEIEIRALFGLFYVIGAMRCSRKNIIQLWDNSRGNGLESCYLTMSANRFRFLLRCLRFDNIRDRPVRKEIDKFAPIRDVFEIIVNNFQKYFSTSEYLTVDEQLLAFRGNCPFRQFVPKKPAKYGLKTFALVNAKTAYTINLETYVGTQPEGPYRQSNAAQDVVLRMVEPVEGTNRNITGDNWFSSIPLTAALKEKGLTYVGTLRKNKRELPKGISSTETKSSEIFLVWISRQ